MLDYSDYEADGADVFDDASLIWDDGDPPADRLRTMSWNRAPAEVRERCWLEIKWRIENRGREQPMSAQNPGHDVNCDRYTYSRRREIHRISSEPRRAVAEPVRNFRPRALAWAFR
jgi:hypothetical protein